MTRHDQGAVTTGRRRDADDAVGGGEGAETSFDPMTGTVNGTVPHTSAAGLAEILARAAEAAPVAAAVSPHVRRTWLHAVAAGVVRHAAELVPVAQAETALGVDRLRGELDRMAGQLRFYADVAAEGSFLRATIDAPSPTNPPLASVHWPLGPVAVFGASNFPFAFGLLGNDTASALAAGCPVIAKAHPAHPLLSRRLGEIARHALHDAGAPSGIFDVVFGFEVGARLVQAEPVRAIAFTGSQRGGLRLWGLANRRDVVVPVFAEMGTVNPVVVTAAASGRMAELAHGFVESFTLGSGQYCTKPGLLFAPRGADAPRLVSEAVGAAAPRAVMLTEDIAGGVTRGVPELCAAGAAVVGTVQGPDAGWSAETTVLAAPIEAIREGSRLLEECFGPVAIVVEYADGAELAGALTALQGALAASVFGGGKTDPDLDGLLRLLMDKVGRIIVDGWPTGVAYTWAQQHGGPWPATTRPATTSVGAAAVDRFLRPVAFQATPDHLLPPPLQAKNPWRLPRRVDGIWHPVVP